MSDEERLHTSEDGEEAQAEQAEVAAEQVAELSIKSNMMWNSAGSLTNLICQYLIGIVIVRLSDGFEAAGVYSLALSVYYVFSTVAEYRMNTIQVSDMRDENTTGEYFAFRLITCGIAFVLTMGYAVLTCAPSTWLAILLFVLYKDACLLIGVLHACNQRHLRMDFTGKSSLLQGIVALGLFVLVFWLTSNLELTLAAMTVAMVLIGVFYSYPQTRQFGPIEVGISWEKTWHLMVSCAPVVIAGVAFSAAASIPKQYLSATLGAAALGAYSSVSQPVAVIQMGASYIYAPLLGYFSQAFVDKDAVRFKRLFTKTAAGIAVVFVICFAGLALLGEPVLVFLCGEGIRPYVYLLQPLSLFAMATASANFLSDLAVALRDFRGSFIGGVVELAISLALIVPIIGVMGMNGVSIVGIISCVIAVGVMLAILYRHVRRTFTGKG